MTTWPRWRPDCFTTGSWFFLSVLSQICTSDWTSSSDPSLKSSVILQHPKSYSAWYFGPNSSSRFVFYCQKGFLKRRLNYCVNSSASFNPLLLNTIRSGDIHPHPGPGPTGASNTHPKQRNQPYCGAIKCLYMNARSLVNKTTELQALASDLDLLAITETWLKPHILDCELLPGLNFTIHRGDRENRSGGGVMLAVKNTIQSLRRIDLEGNAEILLCELRPDARRKILAVVFYRPPDSSLDYLKEFKMSLRRACEANFDQLVICGDFNFPDIDWFTGTASTTEKIHNYFTKIVKDNYLWQMVNFSTRNKNVLDLVLTNIPNKVNDVHGFDDIISTDHKLISFNVDLRLHKKPPVLRA